MGKKRNAPDLHCIAREAVAAADCEPNFPAEVARELEGLAATAGADVKDLRGLLWSSIDNRESRDLDQVEYVERNAEGYRVLVGIADVDAYVAKDSAVDRHAALNTVSVYTPAKVFPMLPTRLSN